MPEIKNTFLKGKMNKDLDDRLLPEGEYRDAVNIQVSKSDENNIGAVQTLRGNKLAYAGENPSLIGEGFQCIGSFFDEKANRIFWFLTDNTNNKTYNITKSHSRTLLDAARLAVNIVGKGTINVRDKDADFPSRGALNIDAARRDFGYDPKVDVEEGFQIYYDWLSNSPFWSSKTV